MAATIRPLTTDRYGRTIAAVECQREDAGTSQVRAGMAWAYRKYSRGFEQLFLVERDVRSVKVGLWSDSNPPKAVGFPSGKRLGTPSGMPNRSDWD